MATAHRTATPRPRAASGSGHVILRTNCGPPPVAARCPGARHRRHADQASQRDGPTRGQAPHRPSRAPPYMTRRCRPDVVIVMCEVVVAADGRPTGDTGRMCRVACCWSRTTPRVRRALRLALEDEGWTGRRGRQRRGRPRPVQRRHARRRADRHHAPRHRRLRGLPVDPPHQRRARSSWSPPAPTPTTSSPASRPAPTTT